MTNIMKPRTNWQAAIILSIVALCAIFTASPDSLYAAAPKKEGAMANPLSVEITGVVVPVSNGRRLVNYAFMNITVYAADDRSANLIRANSFLIKDSIVRATSRAPILQDRSNPRFDVMAFARQLHPIVQSSIPGIRVTRIEVVNPEMMR
jgi:hypothetical protein